ncbi:carbohydrate ABC transporter permease [Thermotoga sp. KOL6]|uniref:carbohydrate ABC transporter permease n=1 Tax=Thermotoga sp. KOL6 TaxID=126741 RepID=UPI000C784696|nr:carbohydrate ABC transporter permease [Thermotoga sp. KOL6]PLV60426.1 sugar ABC transporter ATP-binding protein [Thermotoga sp. KOL6]
MKKFYIVRRALLILIVFIYLLPFIWTLGTSLKPDRELLEYPPRFFPENPDWSNYAKALKKFPFLMYLKNSVIITVGNVIGVLISAPLVAYGFSKINWKGREIFFGIMMSTIMLPGAVTMIPVFLIFRKLGWIDTFLPLVVPAFLGGGAMNVFLIRQFFNTIPNELLEAARIDGAGDLKIFFRIMLPMSKPVLALISVFTFVGSWNNYMGPLIYLMSEEKYPLALGMPTFMSRYGTYWNQAAAASILTLIPTIVFFLFAQKYLIEGIKLSGFK